MENIRTSSYWLGLAPLLHSCDGSYWNKARTPHPAAENQEQIGTMRQRLRTDGYCKFDGGPGPDEVSCMVDRTANAMQQLVASGWHPLWILAYDEPWLLFGRLRGLLGSVANSGEHFGFNWDWMAYHLDPQKTERGWAPHRDCSTMGFDEDGSPQYCSVWLALSDATPDNGCMYALPASFDPAYHDINDASSCPEKDDDNGDEEQVHNTQTGERTREKRDNNSTNPSTMDSPDTLHVSQGGDRLGKRGCDRPPCSGSASSPV